MHPRRQQPRSRSSFIISISVRDTLDTHDANYHRFVETGCPLALKRYTDRLQERIDVKIRRLERDARFESVLLLANRDDLPRNIWWTHPAIVRFVEHDENPEAVEAAVMEIKRDPYPARRLRTLLKTQLGLQGLPLRPDSHLSWSFISGECKELPDKVVAIAQLTAYLWTNGRDAWIRHRKTMEDEVNRLYNIGAAYTWVECVRVAIKTKGFVFK